MAGHFGYYVKRLILLFSNLQDERQQRLREHARRLIAETRLKSNSQDSPTSPIKPMFPQKIPLSPDRTISPINIGGGEEYPFNSLSDKGPAMGGGSPVKPLLISPSKNRDRITPPRDINKAGHDSPSRKFERNGNSPLQSFNSVLERISPKNEKKVCHAPFSWSLQQILSISKCGPFSQNGDQMSYIESELEALEREQEAVDLKASTLEKKLRAVMGGNASNSYGFNFLRFLRPGGGCVRLNLRVYEETSNEGDNIESSDSSDNSDGESENRSRKCDRIINNNSSSNRLQDHDNFLLRRLSKSRERRGQ